MVQRILLYAILCAVGAVLLVPFAWLLSTALKAESADLFAHPPQWIPDPIVWGNFAKAWNILPFMRYLFNTFYIAIATVLLNLTCCSLAGYALARMHFRGRQAIFYCILATTMVPFQVLLIPLFIVTLKLGLVDSYAGVILPVAVNAFGIFLLRQAFTTIPTDLRRRRAHRRLRPVDHLCAHYDALGQTSPRRAGGVYVRSPVERFSVAAGGAQKPRAVHPAIGAGQPPGRLWGQLALHFSGFDHRLGADGAVLSLHPAIFHAGADGWCGEGIAGSSSSASE